MATSRAKGISRKVAEQDRRERGLRTRRRMLDALEEQLRTRSYRDVKVVDITETVGVTPAAFYQYFNDLHAALLVLADEMVADARSLPSLVVGDWETDGRALAERTVDAFMAFWREHEPVLRVVELALDEQDPEFNRIRAAMLSETHLALSFAIGTLQAAGKQPAGVNPRAMAATLLASVIHVSSRMWLYERWNSLSPQDLRESLVDMIETMMTSPVRHQTSSRKKSR